MFLLRNLPKRNFQKIRVTNATKLVTNPAKSGINYANSTLSKLVYFSNFSFFLLAASGGFLHPKCVAYLFTYAKKILKLNKHTARLWVNIPATHIITKKALNVRMGKGKGSRHGINCVVRANTLVVAVSGSRQGLWQKIQRFVVARCSFKIATFYNQSVNATNNKSFATSFRRLRVSHLATANVRTQTRKNYKVTERRKLWKSLSEVYSLLFRVNRMKLMRYLLVTYSKYRIYANFIYANLVYEQYWVILNMRMSLYFVRSYSEYSIILMHEQLPEFTYIREQIVPRHLITAEYSF